MICLHCSKDFVVTSRSGKRPRKYCTSECYLSARFSRVAHENASGMRRCSKCKSDKPQGEFYTNADRSLARWCKECRRGDEQRRRSDAGLVSRFHDKYETDMDFRSRELLRAVQKRCRRGSIPFDLDIAWLSERLRGSCELTGLSFDLSVRSRRPSPRTPSIDRIAPGGGYTKSNCRLVLFAVNAWLKDVTLETMLPIAEALVRRQSKSEAA